MLLTIIESILPGARRLRPPLISGLLWALFLWVLLAPAIPSKQTAGGWFRQAYELAGATGVAGTALIGAVLIFVLGATLTTLTEYLADFLSRVSTPLRSRVDWQAHAQRAARQLKAARERVNQELRSLPPVAPEKTAEGALTAEEQRQYHNRLQLEQQQASLEDRWTRLQALRARRQLPLLAVPDTQEARQVLGHPPARAHSGLEYQLLDQAHREGMDAEIQDSGLSITRRHINSFGVDSRTEARFRGELQPDPLDVLQALDEALFLQLDRERAEREVRLAIALPAVALGLLISVRWSWWGTLLSLLGILMLWRNALAVSDERTRVLNMINMRGLKTPALKEAAADGRSRVRSYLADRSRETELGRQQVP